MQSAPNEILQNATTVEPFHDPSTSLQHGLPESDIQASGRLSEGDRVPQAVPPDNSDASSVSSGGTSRGRQLRSGRLNSDATSSSHSSSPGSRIDEYERKHAKPRKRKDGMIFQVVQNKDKSSDVHIEEFPNGIELCLTFVRDLLTTIQRS